MSGGTGLRASFRLDVFPSLCIEYTVLCAAYAACRTLLRYPHFRFAPRHIKYIIYRLIFFCIYCKVSSDGALAQSGARHTGSVEVTGSNPVCSMGKSSKNFAAADF